jgi:hypothetical protein
MQKIPNMMTYSIERVGTWGNRNTAQDLSARFARKLDRKHQAVWFRNGSPASRKGSHCLFEIVFVSIRLLDDVQSTHFYAGQAKSHVNITLLSERKMLFVAHQIVLITGKKG